MSELEPRRGPGRPPKYEQVAAPAATIQAETPKRPARKPFGAMDQKLAYPDRAGFHRHWFNDVPNRVTRALEAGYTHVMGKDGKNVCHVVGVAESGGPLHAYLMEIPEEWYKQDMAAQEQMVNEREELIKRGKFESQEGDGRYVPDQGIKIDHGGRK